MKDQDRAHSSAAGGRGGPEPLRVVHPDAAGRRVATIIQYVVVILPRMVTRVVIQIADISTIGRHGVGLEEFIRRVLDEGDKARA